MPLPVQIVTMAILGFIASAVLWVPAVVFTSLNYSLGGNAQINSIFQTTSNNTLDHAGLVASVAFISAIVGSVVAAVSIGWWWRTHKRKSDRRGEVNHTSIPRVAVGVMIAAVCADVLTIFWP